jgi:hypothetical protein
MNGVKAVEIQEIRKLNPGRFKKPLNIYIKQKQHYDCSTLALNHGE